MSNIEYTEGWHGEEDDGIFPFRWMTKEAKAILPVKNANENRYISFHFFSEFRNFTQKIKLSLNGKFLCEVPLLHSWNYYSFNLQDSQDKNYGEACGDKDNYELTLSLNKLFPQKYHEGDSRELGIRVSSIEFHNDDEIHKNNLFFLKNALHNFQEMLQGKEKLESYPLNLGVDLYGKCNINPPCVYCLWDKMKELEGEDIDAVVDDKTLESYGPFFNSSRNIVNCSFGEPLLHPRFKEILEFCARHKKIMEISTNGQSFTKRTIEALGGKHIFLYVSLDAACKETYAKIRNDRWHSIMPNLMLLNQERKKEGNFPKIYMVFMPIKVNKNDLEDYFRLCKKIDANALVLRPITQVGDPQIETDRGGYHFDYKNEYLSQEEIEEIIQKSHELSGKYDVHVANQFSFGTIEEPGTKKRGDVSAEAQRF